jgi:signal transduction histidine kinase
LANLVDNAVKYSSKNSLIIISAKKVEDYLEVSVEDEGKGIPVEERTKIFQKFYRASKMAKGFGMGLAICKSLARQLGGDVRLDRTRREGSCFEFVINANGPGGGGRQGRPEGDPVHP